MRAIEFEVGHGESRTDASAHVGRRSVGPAWLVLLAVLLIALGCGLASLVELPWFTYELDGDGRYLSEKADGTVVVWSWLDERSLDEGTIATVGIALEPLPEGAEWSCLPAEASAAPPVPSVVAEELSDNGIVCHAVLECPEGAQPRLSVVTCGTNTVWIPDP